MSDDAVPFWNTNIPPEEWTEECPDYLSGVDAFDQKQLRVKDSDYRLMPWSEVTDLVRTNHLELFKRVPSELRRYRKYIARIKNDYGSVMNFILRERVKWAEVVPKGAPFQCPEDIKILLNDWPYGVDPRITHLVVWTKFGFEEDPNTGDLTPRARREIEDFVTATFCTHADRANVLWFKNWAALKSVHALEHFHVMLYNTDADFIRGITSDDTALSNKA